MSDFAPIDPDCVAGKHTSCVDDLCQCACHTEETVLNESAEALRDRYTHGPPDDTADLTAAEFRPDARTVLRVVEARLRAWGYTDAANAIVWGNDRGTI